MMTCFKVSATNSQFSLLVVSLLIIARCHIALSKVLLDLAATHKPAEVLASQS